MRNLTLAVLLTLLAAAPAAADDAVTQPAEPTALDKLVASVEGFYADKENFSARFEQTVVREHLPDRPIQKSGRVYFRKPGKMRWDYETPDKVFYVSDGKVLWNYIPESKLAYRLDVEDSELFYALKFLFGQGSLARDFALADGGTTPDGNRVIVVKPQKAEHNFQELKLVVATDSPRIVETLLTDPAGNKSRLQFLEVSYQELPDAGFTFTPPEDVQVEDLSEKKSNE